MERVRTLATVFWWLGWAFIVLAVFEAIALYSSLTNMFELVLGRSNGLVSLGAATTTLIIASLQSLIPFFAWGVLTGLAELNGRQDGIRPLPIPSISPPPLRTEAKTAPILKTAGFAAHGWRVASVGADVLDRPSSDGTRMRRLEATDTFEVLGHIEDAGEGNGFYKVRVGGTEGFVADVRIGKG